MSHELSYVALLFGLFVIPKALQRFRIPGAVTSLGLGAVLASTGAFAGDPTIAMLATLGISGLFLFAGLDVDLRDLRRGAGLVLQHLVLQGVLLAATTYGFIAIFQLEWRAAALLALALVTPSTGFILDSLPSFGLDDDQRYWTRTKAIASELVALGLLFAVLQSTSPVRFAGATLAIVAMVALIPALMRLFAAVVVPYAPRSEFAFLVMLAVIAAFATRKLGVYYLVGAFIVGIVARGFRERLPALSSDRMLHAVEVFASLFAPFYFFNAGAHLRHDQLGLASLATAGVYAAVFIPLRLALVVFHRRVALRERWAGSRDIATALLPTLVFSLVLSRIMNEQFAIPEYLVGGVVPYALVTTMIPGFVLRAIPAFDAPHFETERGASGGAPGLHGTA
jgi:Kef-type K+ transport system membrane component KefB